MQYDLRHTRARRGLTLIELIVVLVILIGLAGIIVPMLPNMLTRTHTATAATNIQEIAKLVQTYEQLNFRYPSNWDALTDATGTKIAPYVPDNATTPTLIMDAGLVAGEDTALTNAGITSLAAMDTANPPASGSPTFNPYLGGLIPPAPGAKFVILTQAGMANLGLVPSTGTIGLSKYVVFGFGKASDMIGKVTADPPVHFSDDPTGGPADKYCRFAIVFRVSNATGPLDRAILVGVADFGSDSGISSAGMHIEEYYKAVKASQ